MEELRSRNRRINCGGEILFFSHVSQVREQRARRMEGKWNTLLDDFIAFEVGREVSCSGLKNLNLVSGQKTGFLLTSVLCISIFSS